MKNMSNSQTPLQLRRPKRGRNLPFGEKLTKRIKFWLRSLPVKGICNNLLIILGWWRWPWCYTWLSVDSNWFLSDTLCYCDRGPPRCHKRSRWHHSSQGGFEQGCWDNICKNTRLQAQYKGAHYYSALKLFFSPVSTHSNSRWQTIFDTQGKVKQMTRYPTWRGHWQHSPHGWYTPYRAPYDTAWRGEDRYQNRCWLVFLHVAPLRGFQQSTLQDTVLVGITQ